MKTEYLYISPDKIFEMTYQLGEKIKKSDFKPDCLIGISRGGLCVVRILSDFFDLNEIYIMRTAYYEDIKSTINKPKLIQDVDKKLLEGENILVVDDVADTGGTLVFTVDLLKKRGIKNFKVATLHQKLWSKFKPDFYLEETDKWIIYPWEVGQTIKLIMKKSITKKEKLEELKKTGIPEELINKFIKF
jgi:hypothetical protein